MTPLSTLEVRAGEIRIRLAELSAVDDMTPEVRSELDSLRTEYTDTERRMAALRIAEAAPTPLETRTGEGSAEERAFQELRSNVHFGPYVAAAIAGHGVVRGAEAEYNQHLGIGDGYFPMELLGRGLEERAARDGDAEANQGTWLDRVFAGTAAERLGISFRSVAPGVAAFPVTTAGGAPVQRGRTEAVTESTYTVAVTEIKPSRAAVHGIYSIEDDMRLPGLADGIERDMRMAMTERVDRSVFLGDSGANESGADVTGFQTASIGETTITQTNKIKADETLKAFLGYVDGVYAAMLSDVRIVTAQGANTLWYSTIHNSAASNQTIAQFLMDSGLAWSTRGNIESDTANGDFGAFMGLARGIEGAGIAAVWETGQLITDPYTSATKGEVMLTLNYLWQFALPRSANFKRLKFVT